MSTGSSYTNQSAASRPITALGETAQFQTYASAAYEPDANVSPPATSSLLANLALGERPFISDGVFDPAVKAIAITLICVGAAVVIARLSFLVF